MTMTSGGLPALFQRVPLHGLEQVDHPPRRRPAAGTPLGIQRQRLDLLLPASPDAVAAPRGPRPTSAKKYTHSNAWMRWTAFRYTGATSKSVFNCENRFSIAGCRL